MNIFLTGASGFIGGSVASHLIGAGHKVRGLVRTRERAEAVTRFGIEPVLGSLEDATLLAAETKQADAVINAASADHRAAAETMLDAMAGSGRLFLHTSGSSIVGRRDEGRYSDAIFDEDTPIDPSPARAARVALNRDILAAASREIRAVIIAPSLIYGRGLGVNPDSMQVPWLIEVARRTGAARHIGPGENVWSNVHIDDLVTLYGLVLERAPAGAFYYAENGENSMREVCEAIGRMLGQSGGPEEMSIEEAAGHWGEGPANDTMASNSRVRARRARAELGWAPSARGLIEEIERGCYAGR
ncbi:NAD-dependent epimerase/dehydratase family protein [Nisaea acidiphila]|uniref:NAD-dependent epimerase/dehydratase family protein n=1 Tax=Nisaea acidiphila TaxID=1862145 RepID=A0A9J7ARK5_9PROT|nr:NAD-dependent epimerase/dehydratase family protein [Nisaea acidiphila]UUX49838.1 NAD-dependent epimerase/dehydratase family protein [Nisaea acidiphila]